MGGEEIQLQSFFTSGLDRKNWSFTFASALRLCTAPPVPVKYEAAWGPGMEKFLGCPVHGLREWEWNKDSQPGQIYGKLGDWPEGLSVVSVKFLTYFCTTAADTEPRTFHYLLRVTYTLVISGSDSGHFTEAIPKSRRKCQPAWWTESDTRRRCRSNDTARHFRWVRLGSSTGGKSWKSWKVAGPSIGIYMLIT